AVRRRCHHERGELAEARLALAPVMDRFAHLRHGHAEVPTDDVGEHGRLPPPVLGAGRMEEHVPPEHLAAAPVAGLPAERGPAEDTSVGRATDAVDAGAADD